MNKTKLIHYGKMLCVNKKAYLLLSLSITISLSILLCTIILIDSNVYNKYKNIEALPYGTMDLYTYEVSEEKNEIIQYLLEQENEYSMYQSADYFLSMYSDEYHHIYGTYTYIDSNYFQMYQRYNSDFYKYECIEGICEFNNDTDIIIEKSLSDFLDININENPILVLPVKNNDSEILYLDFNIVGIVDSNQVNWINDDDCFLLYSNIFMNYSALFENSYLDTQGFLVDSINPSVLENSVISLGYNVTSAYRFKNIAQTEKINTVFTKQILLVVLFLILGLNIYGSFMNSLKERYTEIGVKRALGIKKSDIILQFMFEICIVIFINICITIFISSISIWMYKMVLLFYFNTEYIIHFNIYSMLNFIIFSFSILILCGILFSYKASNSKIIDIIKEKY